MDHCHRLRISAPRKLKFNQKQQVCITLYLFFNEFKRVAPDLRSADSMRIRGKALWVRDSLDGFRKKIGLLSFLALMQRFPTRVYPKHEIRRSADYIILKSNLARPNTYEFHTKSCSCLTAKINFVIIRSLHITHSISDKLI